jgi:16S rRNA (guanine966-N2)-methyltransferase
MKITTGLYKGRLLSRVEIASTRETSDRVKQAMFNMLGPIRGSVLDLFSGSGQLGFEALSRGASDVTFIENHPKAIQVIENNALLLGVTSQISIQPLRITRKVLSSLKMNVDLVIMDPPYDMTNYVELIESLQSITSRIMIECHESTHLNERIGLFNKTRENKHGIKKLIYFEKDL